MIVVLFILLASVIVSIVAFTYKKQKFDSIAQPLIL